MSRKPPTHSAPFAVVVDDDPTQLNVLSGLVRKAGLEPRAFAGAEAALAAMSSAELPALIVTDLYMPGIDGWRFCRLLRSPEYAALNQVPILVVSATYAGEEADRIAADLGAEAFLPSPVDGRRFVEQLRAILDGRQMRTPLRVLIVEDGKALAAKLSKAFEANGYQAQTALTTRAAAAAFKKAAYDVAVLDYHLPDGAGDALLDTFRAARPDCVCVMMTTDPGPELALDWMKRGAAACLHKPFKPEYLIELCGRARREHALLRVQDLLEVRTRELRLSEERYQWINDASQDSICSFDLDDRFTSANQHLCATLGLSAALIIGKTPAELGFPADRCRDLAAMHRKTLDANGPLVFEGDTPMPDGRIPVFEFTMSPMRDGDGRLVGIAETSRDITERKRAEEELRESHERLGLALDGGELGMWDWNLRTDAVTYSDRWARMLEYRPDEVEPTVDFFRRHVHPEDLPAVLDRLAGHVEGRTRVYASEHRLRTKSGRSFWAMDRGRVVESDQDGRPVRVAGIIADITERKRAEEALRESEDRFSRAFQTSPYAITITRAEDGKFVEINDAFTSMTGFSREEALADSSIGLKLWVNEEDRRRIVSALGAGRAVVGQEVEFRTKSGKTIAGLFSAQVLRLGQHPCILSSIADITAHKRDEEALRESEDHYRSLVEGAPGIVYSYSSVHGGTFYSSRAADIFGYSPEQLLANPKLWHDAIHPDDIPLVERSVAGAMAGTPFAIEYRIRDAHGGWHWFDDRSTQFSKKGTETVIEGFALDITDRKRAEEEKTGLEAQLQQAQKLESVGRLAGGVAHDFNNMLGVILGHAELALGQLDPAQAIYADLEEIQKAAQRSTALTRQLLAFARKQTIAPKVLDLNESIAGMLKMLQRLIGEDIDLKWQPGADLWPVKVDPSQLDQILANLCVNARDAITDVGKVTIETGHGVFDADYCALHAGFAPGEYVRLAVSDDGCGMDKETLARVFEPFFTTKAIGTGTGLGLATVYGIVKQNDGFIYAYSEPGHGTTFAIYLPRHVGKAEGARTDGAAEPLARGHETILLVEDEPAILEMTKEMLERQGYVVLAAATPGVAIRLADAYPGEIHLLMTDVVMPEMNGRDLARNLLSSYPHLKRLFVSGYTANVIAHRGVLDDGVHFLQKPFSMTDLAAKVRETLESD